MPIRIAVDAMGGDFAPGVVIEGLADAILDHPDCTFVLVGHEEKVRFYLDKYGLAGHPRIELVHAPTVCEMSELSATALRGKKDCSITACARLLKEKAVDAMVTPGHTGATVAATKVLVRNLPGIDRAALAASMPSQVGRFLLVDAGANTDSEPLNLVQNALMGHVYAQYLFNIERPRIGLISVGGEDVKGNELTKETFKLLEKLPINFVGNVEADAAFEGGVDVVIATADGSCGVQGFVTDAIRTIDATYDYFYSCGPLPMLKALSEQCGVDGELSLEERMGCGFGICMGCSIMTRSGAKRVCKEGPVFKKEDIIW